MAIVSAGPVDSMSDVAENQAWLRLTMSAGVGPRTARLLLGAFGLPQYIFSASAAALTEIVPERIANILLAPIGSDMQTQIANTLRWSELQGNHLLTLADAEYPEWLLEIPDPPPLLYVSGQLALLRSPSLAVVGSRNATAQGICNSMHFSETLSRAGLTIVSGLALGIDTAAHEGGLRGIGSTVAVTGTGLDTVYPARNRALARKIEAAGCIVSEYPLGTPPLAANFPRRNRIISGLARAVLVVEAAARSGSLITARMAAEQGRDVFAIPGSINAPLSKGCHHLIKQGAHLAETAQEVIAELGWQLPPATPVSAGPLPANALLHAMGFDPVHADVLAQRCGLDAGTLNADLLLLELDGRVELLPSGMYRRLS